MCVCAWVCVTGICSLPLSINFWKNEPWLLLATKVTFCDHICCGESSRLYHISPFFFLVRVLHLFPPGSAWPCTQSCMHICGWWFGFVHHEETGKPSCQLAHQEEFDTHHAWQRSNYSISLPKVCNERRQLSLRQWFASNIQLCWEFGFVDHPTSMMQCTLWVAEIPQLQVEISAV